MLKHRWAYASCGRFVAAVMVLLLIHASDSLAQEPADESNPYLAAERLSREELGEFLRKMQAKPESIRKRPGFSAALIDAADRILAENKDDALATLAIATKFSALHALSLEGNEQADEQLRELAEAHLKDPREEIARAARFQILEQRVREADELEEKELPGLLAELKDFYAGGELDARHLRMASGTVRIINRLPDDDAAAMAYKDFGTMWAKSKDPELARYGRKISKGAKPAPDARGAKKGPDPGA